MPPRKELSRVQVIEAMTALGRDPALLDNPETGIVNGKHRYSENLSCTAWVELQLMQGRTARELEAEGRARFNYAPRTMRKYVLKVRKRLAKAFRTAETDPDAIRAQAEGMLLQAHAVARADKDAHGMVKATTEWVKLHGANRAEKVEVKHKGLGDMLAGILDG